VLYTLQDRGKTAAPVATNKEKALAAAQKFLERGQPDRALEEFARVVQEEPRDTRTWLKMAEIYARRGDYAMARDIYLRTGELYVELGALPKAVAVYKNALKLSPGLAEGHLRLGAILERLGQLAESLQQFGLAAAAFQKAGRGAEALPALRRIVALAPERVVARIQLAESASQAGETDEAIREFKRAAEFLKTQGRADEYVRVAERLVYHEPHNFPLARELAAVYIARKNPRLALAKLQAAAKAAPRDPENVQLVALALEQLDPPKAVSIWKELAQLHDGAGRGGERDTALRAALALDPRDEDARALAHRWGVRVAGVPAASSSHVVPLNLVPPTFVPEAPPLAPGPRAAPPAAPPAPSADASSLTPTPRPSSDAARILSEAEVFVKYGLLERAVDHLRRLVEREPGHAEARTRLDAVLKQLGRAPAEGEDDPLADVATPPPITIASADVLEAAPSFVEDQETTARVALERVATSEPERGAEAEAEVAVALEAEPAPEVVDALEADPASEVAIALEAEPAPEVAIALEAEPAPEDELTAEPAPEVAIALEAEPAPEDELAAELAPEADAEVAAELGEVDFFVEQSLLDEARATLAELASRFPNHPLVLAKMREVDGRPEADPTGLDDSPGALPRDEAAPTNRPDSGPRPALPVAVMASGGEADLSTHGDLGIAYKEMGLHDAAIAEFKHLTADPARKVFALTMIGECLEAQGALPDAVVRYKEALNSGPVADAESAQLYYLLGSAFERLGDTSEALYFFEKVAKREGQFRDVARRIEALKPSAGAPQ
jgi:tetratricopeptide (TPR) repeat protein